MFSGSKKMTSIVNLTPHDINVVLGNETITFAASGNVARVNMVAVDQRMIDGIPVVFNEPGEVQGLPPAKNNTIYLVSAVVLGATKRRDLFAPDTGPTAIRNDKGQIQAVTRLVSAVKSRGPCPVCGMVDDLTTEGICYMCAEGMAEE